MSLRGTNRVLIQHVVSVVESWICYRNDHACNQQLRGTGLWLMTPGMHGVQRPVLVGDWKDRPDDVQLLRIALGSGPASDLPVRINTGVGWAGLYPATPAVLDPVQARSAIEAGDREFP